MSARIYIIDPSDTSAATCGLRPGVNHYKSRLVRGGRFVAVRTAITEQRDHIGALVGDTQYEVVIDGAVMPFSRWEHMSLIGEPITESDYWHLLEDGKFLDSRGTDPHKAVDLTALPPILP